MREENVLGVGRSLARAWARAGLVVVFTLALTASFTSTSWAKPRYKTLHRFQPGGRGGSAPNAGLVADLQGNFYGTTLGGGAFGLGTVFELAPDGHGGWKETVLHSFNVTDGAQPYAGLVFDAAGNLYGTTQDGGANQTGTVFELSPDGHGGWKEAVLYSFGRGTDGQYPSAGLVLDAAGNLYGTTTNGGDSNYGTVFELAPDGHSGWNETVLHSFNSQDGGDPNAGLNFDAAGNLYGTTSAGGAFRRGTVFELAPDGQGGWKETVLHSFNGVDGAAPSDGLIFDAAGNLYGMTASGGPQSLGTVFELSPQGHGGWKETVLHKFDGTDGFAPFGTLIFGSAGNLYGTAAGGGTQDFGSVFELAPDGHGGWKETVLHSLKDRPGASPFGGLILGGQGHLYGTTAGDGQTTLGSVFELAP